MLSQCINLEEEKMENREREFGVWLNKARALLENNQALLFKSLAPFMSGGQKAGFGKDTNSIAEALVHLLSLIFYEEFRWPQPQVGRYDVATNYFEKIKWVYRYWFNQLEVAEKDSGIEDYFRQQVLAFPLPEGFEETARVSLSAGGDLMAVDVLTGENMTELFDDVKDFYFSADIVCANLESTVYEDAPFGRNQVAGQAGRMNTSEGTFQCFYDGGNGINCYTTANNHGIDYGREGLFATLDILDKYKVWHCGTNRIQEEQDDVLIIEEGGIRIAMLAYTMDLNGYRPEEDYMINCVRFNDEACDIAMVERHVSIAKRKGADVIIAHCHWGWEFEMYPHKNVIEVGHRIIELGVNVILGNHPHVAQPMERYTYEKDGKENKGLIVYANGDFVAYHPKSRNSRLSYIVKFDVAKGTANGTVAAYITNLKVLPVYMLNEQLEGNRYRCRMLKFSHVLADMMGEDGKYQYGLTALEREQLPHLAETVLRQILLPANHEGLLAE